MDGRCVAAPRREAPLRQLKQNYTLNVRYIYELRVYSVNNSQTSVSKGVSLTLVPIN